MLLLLAAWISAFAGAALALLLGFANGMKTAPSRSRTDLVIAGTLPLVALALAVAVLWRSAPAGGVGRALWQGGVPLLVGLLGLAFAVDWQPKRSSARALFERETGTRPDGTKFFRDSAKNWNHDERTVRETAAREAAGAPPPANAASWAEFWSGYLAGVEKWQKNAPRYIARVHELRREAQLPELPAVARR